MSVGVFARWTEAFPRHLAASRTFFNSSVPVSAMDVGHRSRKLSDASACAPPGATSWMGRVNKFLLNEAYGAVLLNMIADVLVRCMMYLLLPLLALKFFRGARNKELESTLERLKQALDKIEDREKAFLDPDSNFCRMFESALSASKSGHCVHISSNGHGQPCGDADSTVSSASTSEVVKRIPKNGYPESYVEPYDAEYISGTLKTTPETSSIADHASTSMEKVQEGALKPDIKQRVDHLIKHLRANKECLKVDEGTQFSFTTLNLYMHVQII